LRPVRLPGGDAATRFPLRAAAGYLAAGGMGEDALREELESRGLSREAADAVVYQIEHGANAPWTTSGGRFLDAVAAWTGVCRERTYEGEPAMRLEAVARGGAARDVGVPIREVEGHLEVDLVTGFAALVEMAKLAPVADVAATAQSLLAQGTAAVAVRVARDLGIGVVCLSGGVAVNDAIAVAFRRRIEAAGLRTVTNEWTPCGDGGVSFGQAAFVGGDGFGAYGGGAASVGRPAWRERGLFGQEAGASSCPLYVPATRLGVSVGFPRSGTACSTSRQRRAAHLSIRGGEESGLTETSLLFGGKAPPYGIRSDGRGLSLRRRGRIDEQVGDAIFPSSLGLEVCAVRGLAVERELCRLSALEDCGARRIEKAVQRLQSAGVGAPLARHRTECILQESAVDLMEIEVELLVVQCLGRHARWHGP
jgi:hypothetical protein